MSDYRKVDFVLYFESLADQFHKTHTPDAVQGGISIIRYPHLYDISTLRYWYEWCKRLGY